MTNLLTTLEDERAVEHLAARARRSVLRLGHAAGGTGAHYGPALSLIEVMAAIYSVAELSPGGGSELERDRVILSKGHGSLALYTVLHEFGHIPGDVLETAELDGTRLPGQPIRDRELGVEFSSGSLGMGLGYGVGLALSARMMKSARQVFVVMGDGETNEGSVWEAAMAATHFGLDTITAFVDVNDLQSDGSTSEIMSFDHAAAWAGFGWDVIEVDGHSIPALQAAIRAARSGRPRCILARTVKGKGISFMEGVAEWHHGRLTEPQFAEAQDELEVERR
jgi:transketolase